ncbi:MAG: hydroxymethylbilane synthase, partial [Cyanobacteria bacterium P01_D01_bin.36]
VLAAAGLNRLDMSDRIHQILPPEISLHAVGQGALGIECRQDDKEILSILKVLEHTPTAQRCYAERAFLRELEGGCQVPIGVNTVIEGDTLTLKGIVASLDGQQLIKDVVTGSPADAQSMGEALAKRLRSQGAQEILDVINAQNREA